MDMLGNHFGEKSRPIHDDDASSTFETIEVVDKLTKEQSLAYLGAITSAAALVQPDPSDITESHAHELAVIAGTAGIENRDLPLSPVREYSPNMKMGLLRELLNHDEAFEGGAGMFFHPTRARNLNKHQVAHLYREVAVLTIKNNALSRALSSIMTSDWVRYFIEHRDSSYAQMVKKFPRSALMEFNVSIP